MSNCCKKNLREMLKFRRLRLSQIESDLLTFEDVIGNSESDLTDVMRCDNLMLRFCFCCI